MAIRLPNSGVKNDGFFNSIITRFNSVLPKLHTSIPPQVEGSLIYDPSSQSLFFSDGLLWKAVSSGGLIPVTWRPGYTGSDPNVFSTWTDVYIALSSITGLRYLVFDPSLIVPPLVIPTFIIPPGVYDMTDVTWYSLPDFVASTISSSAVSITISDGVTLPGLRNFNGPMLISYNGTTVPCVNVPVSTASNNVNSSISILNGAFLSCTGSQPLFAFFDSGVSGLGSIDLNNGTLQMGTTPVVSCSSMSKVVVAVFSLSAIENETFSGAGLVNIVLFSHSSIAGTPTQIPFDVANFTAVTGTITLVDATGSPKTVIASGLPVAPYDSTGGFNTGDIYLNSATTTFYMFDASTSTWLQIS